MNFRNLSNLDAQMRGGLVVSCQPVEGGAMDDDATVVRIACAAVAGGAHALRLEGAGRVARVAHMRAQLRVPIIGIIKRDFADTPVRITPLVDDVAALAGAGADVIAVDATARPRPATVAALLAAIRAHGALAMADCASEAEAVAALALGFDVVGTTLSGYTGGPIPSAPDYALLTRLCGLAPRVMAEGRFNTPTQVAEAIRCGAWAVTVGTAITRTEVVTGWFVDALKTAHE